ALMLALIPEALGDARRRERRDGDLRNTGKSSPAGKLLARDVLTVNGREEPPAGRIVEGTGLHGADALCVPQQIGVGERAAVVPGVGASAHGETLPFRCRRSHTNRTTGETVGRCGNRG